jgi:hypothetical protein
MLIYNWLKRRLEHIYRHLEAIGTALRDLPDGLQYREVTVMTSRRSVLEVIARPRQQSGQRTVHEIYKQAERLQEHGNMAKMLWVLSGEEGFPMGSESKAEARRAARANRPPETPAYQARSTQIRLAMARQRQRYQGTLLMGPGGTPRQSTRHYWWTHPRSVRHFEETRESNVFAQLRTGMARISSYLHKIGAADTDMCECRQAPDTMEQFLFRRTKWDAHNEKAGEGSHKRWATSPSSWEEGQHQMA